MNKKQIKTKAPAIERITILNEIGNCFLQVIQWRNFLDPSWADHVSEYLHKAIVLIELLEVTDCGSIGGFDKLQPDPHTLFDRYDWLFQKYHNPKDKQHTSIRYEEIRNYFNQVGES